jgi:hypothetical protein
VCVLPDGMEEITLAAVLALLAVDAFTDCIVLVVVVESNSIKNAAALDDIVIFDILVKFVNVCSIFCREFTLLVDG